MIDPAATQRILDVAVTIMQSDFASMQVYDQKRHAFRLITNRGFSPAAAEQFAWIFPHSGTSCAQVLRTMQRKIVPDIDQDDDAVAAAREAFRGAGIHAMQSTPLCSSGRLVGAVSTHWRSPHRPTDYQINVFDVWARQTADVFVRNTELTRLLQMAQAQLERSKQLTDQFERLLAKKVMASWTPPSTLH
jgi:GAF domain-containing protein